MGGNPYPTLFISEAHRKLLRSYYYSASTDSLATAIANTQNNISEPAARLMIQPLQRMGLLTAELSQREFAPVETPARAVLSFAKDSPLNSGILDYWKLDETMGGRVGSVNYKTLALVGAEMGAAAGIQGNCVSWSSSETGYLELTGDTDISALTSWSMVFWIKKTGAFVSTPGRPVQLGTSASSHGLLTTISSGDRIAATFRLSGGTDTTIAFGLLAINTWTMVAMGYGGGTIWGSVNGGARSSSLASLAAPNGRLTLMKPTSNPLDMDEFILYNRSLSAADVVQLYHNGVGVTYPIP